MKSSSKLSGGGSNTMQTPYYIQRLLNNAEFRHVDSEYHESMTYLNKDLPDGHPDKRWSKTCGKDLKGLDALEQWLEPLERKRRAGTDFEPKSYEHSEFIGGFRLLIQRTRLKREVDEAVKPTPPPKCAGGKALNLKDVKPKSPLIIQWENASLFKRVSAVLNLPPTYVAALDHASGHVEVSKIIGTGDKNDYIGFLAQNTDYHWDHWSLALCYDPRTKITTGLLCAEEKKGIDINAIINELNEKNSPTAHPVLLPVIMFDRLLQSSVSHYAHLHKAMCHLEDEVGCAECKGRTSDEDIKHNDWTQRLNLLKKQQASRDGRHQFWRQFHSELLAMMETIAHEVNSEKTQMDHLELEQRIQTISGKFKSSEGRDINSNRRIDAQLKLLYNIIQQNESRSQFHIAAAMSKDSSEVAFLTWIGAIFLPASVVGSFLGIQSITVKSDLEIVKWFFMCTLPLVAAVLCVFPLRMVRRKWVERRKRARMLAITGEEQDTDPSFQRRFSNVLTWEKSPSRSPEPDFVELKGITVV